MTSGIVKGKIISTNFQQAGMFGLPNTIQIHTGQPAGSQDIQFILEEHYGALYPLFFQVHS